MYIDIETFLTRAKFTKPQKMQAVQPASITIPFQEFAKENQKPLAVIGGDI